MEQKKHNVTAFRVCEKIPIRQLNNIEEVLGATIVYRSSEQLELHKNKYRIYMFNFGGIAFFDCPAEEQGEIITRFLTEFSSIIVGIQWDLTSLSDSVRIKFSEETKIDFDCINLSTRDNEPLRIIALVLAHSVVIDYYERHVENMIELSTNYMARIRGKIPRATKNLVTFLVEGMQTKQHIITNLFVLDSPEEVWENPELDKIYQETRKMFEISSRFKAIDYKLKLIQDNLAMIVNLSSNQSNLILELAIVLLIIFEILMTFVRAYN